MKKLLKQYREELRKSRFSVFKVPRKLDVHILISADETVIGIEVDGVVGLFTSFNSHREIISVVKTLKKLNFEVLNIAPLKTIEEEGVQDLSYLRGELRG